MNIYTQNNNILCSCIYCKEVKSAKGILHHYRLSHTESGKNEQKLKAQKANKNAALAHKELRIKRINSYNLNPSKCVECQSHLPYSNKNNKFCSRSCSATYNNKFRDSPSNETRKKISKTLKTKYSSENIDNNIKPQFTTICFCNVCNKPFASKSISTKTCSSQCRKKLLSNIAITRIKNNRRSNYRRDKKSFLEDSFEKWLTANNISDYESEYTIHNHLTKQWYFVDFYFPKLNLIVELDGKQHEKEYHKIKDKIRDDYISNHLGITVFRISHKEYIEKSKINSLLEIMVPREGNAPSFTV